MHPALKRNGVAVVTGGASGLGLAASRRLASIGMRLCVVDYSQAALDDARDVLKADGVAGDALAFEHVDVSDREALKTLEKRVTAELGPVSFLMCNAGIQPGSSIFDEDGTWERVLDVNLWGIVRTAQTFAPAMVAGGAPGLVVTTGSKQGITTPPGDPAYNVSKAGVKVFTEALQHHLRGIEGCKVEARLFIPGFVFTGLTRGERTEKPAGAHWPEETIAFLFDALDRDDFYILCPDNDVDRATDEKRILWAAGDIVENRPPLSRWHKDFEKPFSEWLSRD